MRTRVLIAVAIAAMAASPAFGQSKTGTTVGQFLMIEPSARIAGMGNAGVSLLVDGVDAAYYNVASLSDLERPTVQFSHSAWLAGIRYDYVAGAFRVGRWGNAMASITSLGSGDIEVRTVAQPLGTGQQFSVSDLALSLGYARRITDRFSAGAQLSYVQETIWNTSIHTATVNIGTLFRLSEDGLHIGSSLSNYGTQAGFSGRDLQFLFDADPSVAGDNSALPADEFTDHFPVPVLFRVGVSLPHRIPRVGRLVLAADAFHPSDNSESISMGAEFTYHDVVAGRVGYQNLFMQDSEVGLTAGGGFKGTLDERVYRVDYAWADQGRLGGTHRVTLGLTF
jgi:hypothetical protein